MHNHQAKATICVKLISASVLLAAAGLHMPATPAVFDVRHSTLAANVDKELDTHMFSLQVRLNISVE
jgi:hypothetical protein